MDPCKSRICGVLSVEPVIDSAKPYASAGVFSMSSQQRPRILASDADQGHTISYLSCRIASQPVQWTPDTRRSPMKHVRVDHRRLDVAMAQQLLNRSNVRAAFKQVRGKGMPEGACLCQGHGRQVADGLVGEASLRHGVSDGFLHQ